LLQPPRIALAQEPTALPLRLRGSVAGGAVVSADQRTLLDLELPLVEGRVAAGWVAHEVLVVELAFGGGLFFADQRSPGGLIDVALGAEVGGTVGPARLYADLQFGAGATGQLVRPTLRIAFGADMRITPEWTLGPVLAYGHDFEEDSPARTDDAIFLEGGLSFTFQAVPSEPPPPPPPPPIVRRPPPRLPPPPPEDDGEEILTLVERAVGVETPEPRELLVPVLFEYDSTDIVACSLPALHALREHLESHPSIRVLEIEGHADSRGSSEYNAQLSLRRAEAIRAWLIARGIAPERLRAVGRGEEAPVESAEDDAALQQNRRARFRVIEEDPP
jgi:outer membrane protein OmpA-like peptidoglycan-associated protein